MCNVCGCGQGETRIDGQEHDPPHVHDAHTHVHAHENLHADGAVHSHAHGRAHSHTHSGHDHVHDALHAADMPHAYDHPLGGDLHYGLGPARAHAPGLSQARMVRIEQDILAKNNAYAAANRKRFAEHGIFAVNLVSSPGSGKTTLLVKTIEALRGEVPMAVIEGDQQTSMDADRIRATGVAAVQVNTGRGCHLDAHMVGHAVERLHPAEDSLLFIENVGNLVCPAGFDLGEAHKVVILSVTEGEDKPLKYPDMFHAAGLMLLNKMDLLPHLAFDTARCVEYARRINPRLEVIELSAVSGQGMQAWLAWLTAGLERARLARQQNVDLLKRRIAELEAQLAAKS